MSEPKPRTEYEQRRLEKIAKNHELLRSLQTDARLSGLILTENKPKPTAARGTVRKREAKEPIQPVRASARLRGLQADGTVAVKREAEEAAGNADGNKRMRVGGDLNVSDIITSGAWDTNGQLLKGLNGRGYELPFDPQSAKETSDADLRRTIENFGDLGLWQNVEPNSTCDSILNAALTSSGIKVTPERAVRLANLALPCSNAPSTAWHFTPRPRRPSYLPETRRGTLEYSTARRVAR